MEQFARISHDINIRGGFVKKNILCLFIVMILFALSGRVSQTTAVSNTIFEQDSHEIMVQVSMQELIGDIYVPLTIPDLVQSGQTLIEFTLVEVLSTSIEGAPQGWVGNNHNQFLLRVDNVLLDGSWVRAPYIGEEITILSHHYTEYFEGQRYLSFVHFDIINNQKDGVPPGMTPYSLDSRVTAIVNENRTITATGFLGFYLREFDGYAVEQMMERIQRYQVPMPDPPLRGLDISSEWARESIRRAHSLGIIPLSLFAFPTFTDYTLPATRAELAALAVALYENMTGGEITGRTNFNDTSDVNVQKMGYLGVVSGVGGGSFNPYGEITREQAAVILVRLFNAIYANLDTNLPAMLDLPYLPSVFTDYEQISPWAFNGVASAFGLNIMSGVGDRRFAPQSPYTREQSIVTILQLFDMVDTGLPNALETETADTLNYAEFLRLLEANGFVFETRSDVPTRRRLTVYIGDESLVVQCADIPFDESIPLEVQITWTPEFHWPTRGSMSVIYSGDDSHIIEFLNATFGYNPAREGR